MSQILHNHTAKRTQLLTIGALKLGLNPDTHPRCIHGVQCELDICICGKELLKVRLTPWLPVALPRKQLHVAVYVVCAVAVTAGRALQVVQLLHSKPQVVLAVAVLFCCMPEGVCADWPRGLQEEHERNMATFSVPPWHPCRRIIMLGFMPPATTYMAAISSARELGSWRVERPRLRPGGACSRQPQQCPSRRRSKPSWER